MSSVNKEMGARLVKLVKETRAKLVEARKKVQEARQKKQQALQKAQEASESVERRLEARLRRFESAHIKLLYAGEFVKQAKLSVEGLEKSKSELTVFLAKYGVPLPTARTEELLEMCRKSREARQNLAPPTQLKPESQFLKLCLESKSNRCPSTVLIIKFNSSYSSH